MQQNGAKNPFRQQPVWLYPGRPRFIPKLFMAEKRLFFLSNWKQLR